MPDLGPAIPLSCTVLAAEAAVARMKRSKSGIPAWRPLHAGYRRPSDHVRVRVRIR
jgi:hypothetical protein